MDMTPKTIIWDICKSKSKKNLNLKNKFKLKKN